MSGIAKIIPAKESTKRKPNTVKLMKINEKIGLSRCIGDPRQILRIMKLTILIMTVCLMQVSALTNAQITINAKQESLRNVLKKISQQSGYDFIYSVQDFKNAIPVDLKLTNVSIEKALSAAFYGQPLIYEVSDKTVMVKKQVEKSYLETVIARFQAIDIRGKVVDSLGAALAGATVSVKNGKGSTSTAANGDFYLKNVEEGAVLVISFLGYVTKEQMVNKDFNYVILKQSTSQLDEVLVQAYGTTTRRLSTGNIAMITSKEISQQNINNPLLALQGRVAGVEVSPTNGLPGAPINIKIRGEYSLRGGESNEPLIVIDGVPFANNIQGLGGIANGLQGSGAGQLSAFNFINPNEIESISVLKDADATSIYGSRGSKGVILITTKKGKAGLTAIDVTINRGLQEVGKNLELLNTEEYLEMRMEALKNGNRLSRLNNPSIYAAVYPDLLVWDQKKYTNWQEVLLGNTARYLDIQSTVSGGTDLVQYRLGGTFHEETYVFPGDSYDRKGSVNMNVNGASSNRKFKAMLGGAYTFDQNILPFADLTTYAMILAPNAPNLYNESGEVNWEPNPFSPIGEYTFDNPINQLKKPTIQKLNSLISNAELSYEILPQLFIKSSMGFTKVDGNSFRIRGSLATTDPNLIPYLDPTYLRTVSFMKTGTQSWNVEPQIVYNAKIWKGNLNGLLGGTLQNQSSSSEQIDAYGFNSDAVMQSLSQATGYQNIGNSSAEYKYNAIFARLNYNWDNKYLINLSARRDGSSRFGPGRQFGNFWSIGTAWIFTQEKLLQSLLPFFSFGKLKFSYGTSGNDGIPNYSFFELYNPVTSISIYRDNKLLSSSGITNLNFGWESVKKMELGLDLWFFNDRLNLSASYFRNRSSDLLGRYPVPEMVGPSTNLTVNQPALIQTSGWEFLFNSINVSNSSFKWNSSMNIGLIRNKMLADNDGDRTKPGLGKPFYGFVYPAVFNGVDPVTGQYQFLGTDGNPTYLPDGAGTTKIRVQPLFSGGLNNSFSYKKISLDIFLQFIRQNGRNYLYQFDLAPGFPGNQPVEVMRRWRSPGDYSDIQRFNLGGGNQVPEITVNDAYKAVSNSSAAWVDASFIRLKTVSLSYGLGDILKQKLHLKNLRLFVQGQNLWTWTNYQGTDPETQNPFVLPPLRTITTGIHVTL